jgi:wobble nucleotide-excising tRNase
MPLEKIIDIQKVGCFERLRVPSGLRFSKVTLVFGENGWGKSTIADILRSLTTDDPRILCGRETLASAGNQKVVLLIDGRQAEFDGARWQGVCPKVAVYDQIFVNQNVFSGDTVSHDHLKRQYGLVVGEAGVRLMREIISLDAESRDINAAIRKSERALQAAVTTLGLTNATVDQFVALGADNNIDELIAEKEKQVQRAARTDEIKKTALPEGIPLPSEAEPFRAALTDTIEGVADDAYQRMRAHIESHRSTALGQGSLTHEGWLEAGLAFKPDDPCPYCGQVLRDRVLVDAYQSFFSEAYKTRAQKIKRFRATLQRHSNGEFAGAVRQALRNVDAVATTWKTLAEVKPPDITFPEDALKELRASAEELDKVFEAKQADLVTAIADEAFEQPLARWEAVRLSLSEINSIIAAYNTDLEQIKKAQEGKDLEGLNRELVIQKARKRRFEKDIVADIDERQAATKRKGEIDKEKREKRAALTRHTTKVTDGLGTTINAYLDRLGAGFRIDYRHPDYRGKEPAAAYNILINNVPVPPRATNDDIAKPTFKNTLSAGDKSVLALAIFLATLRTRADLDEMIVVLDDPFTSMDEFRRTFTVNEINKLVPHSAQIIVLSHEKNFLRLIWDTIDQSYMTALSIQTGAPGMATLAAFDLQVATRPRYVSERMEVEEFVELGKGNPGHIRALLRTVLENFYRQGDPELFARDELLDSIIRKLQSAAADHRYKGALEPLEEINRYTRNFHHAPVEGSVCEDTNIEELKTYCRRVIALTRGSA